MVLDDDKKEKDFKELKPIDINDMSLADGRREEINPDADAWAVAAPPPDGIYMVQLFPSRKAWEQGETEEEDVKERRMFVRANLDLKIQEDKDWKDSIIFANVSTLISAGKEISTMAGLIRKFGPVKIPNQITPLETARLLARCLKQEPKLYVEGEWKAWDNGNKEWFKQGMKTFPLIEGTKRHNHVVRDAKGNVFTAKFKVTHWYGLKEYKQMLEAAAQRKGGLSAPATQGVRQPEQVIDGASGGGFAEMPVSGRQQDSAQQTRQQPAEEEFLLDS